MSPTDAVSRLIAAWENLDIAALAGCFTQDAVWHNIPFPPIKGRDKIVAAIAGFFDGIAEAKFHVHHRAEAGQGRVMTERNDVFRMKDGKVMDIPVMGIFELEGDRVRAWRDYFDPATMNI